MMNLPIEVNGKVHDLEDRLMNDPRYREMVAISFARRGLGRKTIWEIELKKEDGKTYLVVTMEDGGPID